MTNISNSQRPEPGSLTPWTRWILPVLTLTILAISALSSDIASQWYSRLAYYLMWVPLILWVIAYTQMAVSEKWRAADWVQRNRVGIFLAAVLTAAVAFSVPATLRVLSDEANVIAVSRSMSSEKRAENITHGYQYYFSFHAEKAVSVGVEKHALLFPFLAHMVHAVSGYRVENIYALNLLLFFLTLLLAHHLLAPRAGPYAAAAGQLFMAATPIITIVGRSGGVDLLAALTLLLSVWAAILVVRSATEERQIFLLTTLVLWINTRQEAPASALALLAVLTVAGKLHWRKLAAGYIRVRLLILCLLPALWQRILVKDPFEEGAGEAPFGLHHLISNNWKFIQQFWDARFFVPFNPPLLWLGTIGAAVLAWAAWKDFRREGSDRSVFLICSSVGAMILAQWVTITAYFRGVPDHPSCSRYFVPFCVVLAITGAWFLGRKVINSAAGRVAVAGIGLLLFIVYNPVAANGSFVETQIAVREYRFVRDFLRYNAPKNSLIISGRPGHYAIHEYGSLGFGLANKTRSSILNNFQNHLFADIFVVQSVNPVTGKVLKNHDIHPDYVLETVAEMQNTPTELTRISAVLREAYEPGAGMGTSGNAEPFTKVVSNIPGIDGEIGIVDPSHLAP